MKLVRILLLLVLLLGPVSAQLLVEATMPRSNFLPNEVIPLRVSVTNQSGGPLSFGNHGGHSWLTVEVNDIEGRPLNETSDVETEAFMLRPGETQIYEVQVSQLADMVREGSYRVRARVYYSRMDRTFDTTWMHVRVRDGVTIWEQSIGLPGDLASEGRHRTYKLIRAKIANFQALFVDISEPSRHLSYAVYPLGAFIEHTQPQYALDSQGVLHVVYQTNPRLFVYQRIDHMGNLLEDRQMRAEDGRPRLVGHRDGTVEFSGPADVAEVENALPPELGGAPSLSDRPEGLDFGSEE